MITHRTILIAAIAVMPSHAANVVLPSRAANTMMPSHAANTVLHTRDVRGAQPSAPAPMLVPVDWLAQHIKDRDVIVFHVGSPSAYFKEHIAGAQYLDEMQLSAPANNAGLGLELPTPAVARAELERIGVSDKSHIVLYYGTNEFTQVTRIVHALNYLGLGDRVSVLDGGMQAWKHAGHAVTDAPATKPKRGALTAVPTNDVTVTGDWVAAHLKAPGYILVDARGPNGYDGVPGPGHIPGAVSIPAGSLFTDEMRFDDKATVEEKLRKAGVAPGDTIIAYCNVGEVATTVVFLSRLAGHPVKLYDGSIQDWSARPNASYEKGSKPGH